MSAHQTTQTDVMGMDVDSGPTPEQLAIIEKVAAEFHEDWELVFKPLQIRRRERTRWQKVRDWFRPRRHSIFAMYWWLKQLYAGKLDRDRSTYMPFIFPLKHDNMPFEGYPMKYKLMGNWTIPKSDLRYLTYGPLGDQQGRVIVTDKPPIDRLKELAAILWQRIKSPFVQLSNFLIFVGGVGGGVGILIVVFKFVLRG